MRRNHFAVAHLKVLLVATATGFLRPDALYAAEVRASDNSIDFLPPPQIPQRNFDVVVFGATPAGVMASIAAARHGQHVVLIEPSYLVGGMMSGGLTKTDMGRTDAIGGMAREFYDLVVKFYRQKYGADSSQAFECNYGYYFESKLALDLFNEMLTDAKVEILTRRQLDDVTVHDHRIAAIATHDYATGEKLAFGGKVFIDASYEGDLMAGAHILYRVGREARSEYGESMAGLTEGPPAYLGTADHRVQTFNIRGGLTNRADLRLPFPKPSNYYPESAASYISSVKNRHYHSWRELFPNYSKWGEINGHFDSNSGDFPGINFAYAESDNEGRARIARRVRDHWLSIWWGLQNDPTLPADFHADAMNWGVAKDEYLESDHVSPQIYVRECRRMLGRYFMTQNDLVDDRFKTDTICLGNYGFDSHYVQQVLTDDGLAREGEISGSTDLYAIPYRSLLPTGIENLIDPVTISASAVAYSSIRMEPVYMMMGQAAGVAAALGIRDSRSMQAVDVAALQAELRKTGTPLVPTFRPVVAISIITQPPYQPGEKIEFRLIKKDLHAPLKTIAWNFDGSGAVQAKGEEASYIFSNARDAVVMLSVTDGDGLTAHTQMAPLKISGDAAPDIEVPFHKAKLHGNWSGVRGAQMEYYYRMGVTDAVGRGDEPVKTAAVSKPSAGDGSDSAIFTARLPRSGRYRVAMSFPSTGQQATNAPFVITHAGGSTTVVLNERKLPPFAFSPLGDFTFEANTPAVVSLSNTGTDGGIAVDAVRFIWLGE